MSRLSRAQEVMEMSIMLKVSWDTIECDNIIRYYGTIVNFMHSYHLMGLKGMYNTFIWNMIRI